jgi:hypothetical protein
MFTKENILNRIKQLVQEYPDHFDSSVKDRIECGVSVFRVRIGIINNYYYLISDGPVYIGPRGWFMTDGSFINFINNHKENGKYCVVLNIKETLRNIKLNKICQNLTSTKIINLVQE